MAKLPNIWLFFIQVIQFVTFISPIVGGHQQPFQGSRLHHHREVTIAELLDLLDKPSFETTIIEPQKKKGLRYFPRSPSCLMTRCLLHGLRNNHHRRLASSSSPNCKGPFFIAQFIFLKSEASPKRRRLSSARYAGAARMISGRVGCIVATTAALVFGKKTGWCWKPKGYKFGMPKQIPNTQRMVYLPTFI